MSTAREKPIDYKRDSMRVLNGKRDLERLYTLSNNVHSHGICAPDPEVSGNTQELEEAGLI